VARRRLVPGADARGRLLSVTAAFLVEVAVKTLTHTSVAVGVVAGRERALSGVAVSVSMNKYG
jgi:hypothetical protein